MQIEAFEFELPAVVKLLEAAVEDDQYWKVPSNVEGSIATGSDVDRDRTEGPALWLMSAGDAIYLMSNGVHVAFTPIYASGCPTEWTGEPVLRQTIVLDDEFVLDLLTAADLGLAHLMVLDRAATVQVAVTVQTCRRAGLDLDR